MAGFEGGYKGPEEKQDIHTGMPESFESQKNDTDKQGENTKGELDDLKKQIDNQNNQLNLKIEETIDTFEELSGKKIDENDKKNLIKLLSDGANKSGKPNQYLGEITDFVKEFDTSGTLDDLNLFIEETNKNYNIKIEKQDIKGEKQDESLINKEELSKNQKEYDSVENILGGLKGENEAKYKQVLDLVKEHKLDDAISELSNLDTLQAVASDLKKQDPAKYKTFRDSLITIQPDFREKFDQIETGFHSSTDQLKLGTKTEKGIEKDGDIIRQKTDDGINIEVGEDGRKVGLSESDYKLQSDLGNENVLDEVENKKEEFSKFMKGINEELNSISSVLDYIDNAISNNIEIDDVKEEIRETNSELYNSLNLDSFTDIQEMKNAISGLYKQKEEEKEKYVKQAKRIVDEIVEKNALNAREKDEKVQDTLKFLKSIGFDLIPQDITDNIISQLNSNSGLRNMLGFNSLIDFENGNLGIDSNGDSNNMSLNEKVKFAEIFNTMIGGDDKGPININALRNASGSPISNTSNFNVYLVDNKLKDSGYASSIMLRNLEKFATKGK